jgi:hypothetical protein
MLKRKKTLSMKMNLLLLGAVVSGFTLTSFAAGPLLSPRAQANRIPVATSSITTQGDLITCVTSASPTLLSPHAQASQIQIVKGIFSDVNPAWICQKTMSGSPKIVAACSSNTSMPRCVRIASLK